MATGRLRHAARVRIDLERFAWTRDEPRPPAGCGPLAGTLALLALLFALAVGLVVATLPVPA